MPVSAMISLQAQSNQNALGICKAPCVNLVYFWHMAYLLAMVQAIAILLMGNFQQQSTSFQSVLIHAMLSQSNVSSRKHGDTWMHIGMHTTTPHMHRLDNMTLRKRLNTHQAAFANKQYKSYCWVGLLSDIIRSLAIQDAQKAL
jgi:hypothetical protein